MAPGRRPVPDLDRYLDGRLADIQVGPEYAGADPAGAMVARSRALLLDQGVDPDRITCEVDRPTAIRCALNRARAGDLVVLLAGHEEVRRVVDQWRAGSD